MYGAFKESKQATIAPADFLDYRDRNTVFSELAARSPFGEVVLTGGDAAERLRAPFVSANFFATLRVAPLLGRAFLPEEQEGSRPSRGRALVRPLAAALRRGTRASWAGPFNSTASRRSWLA